MLGPKNYTAELTEVIHKTSYDLNRVLGQCLYI